MELTDYLKETPGAFITRGMRAIQWDQLEKEWVVLELQLRCPFTILYRTPSISQALVYLTPGAMNEIHKAA